MLSRIAYYAWGALVAPRATAREMVSEPDLRRLAWTIAIVSSLMLGLLSVVDEAWLIRFAPERSEGVFLSTDSPPGAKIATSFLFMFLVSIAFFAGAVFLWKHLFGFREKTGENFAATGLVYAFDLLALVGAES